jgi:hypothetical protein
MKTIYNGKKIELKPAKPDYNTVIPKDDPHASQLKHAMRRAYHKAMGKYKKWYKNSHGGTSHKHHRKHFKQWVRDVNGGKKTVQVPVPTWDATAKKAVFASTATAGAAAGTGFSTTTYVIVGIVVVAIIVLAVSFWYFSKKE